MSGTTWVAMPDDSPFPLENLPPGIAHGRAVVAIGDHAVDLAWLHDEGWLSEIGLPAGVFATGRLNDFLSGGPATWTKLRGRLQELLTDAAARPEVEPALQTRRSLQMQLPVEIGDYVDFYSSLHHATNLGRILRPGTEPLPANWRHLPVGYHGRSGTFVGDGATIPRPNGLRLVDGSPTFGPSARLDFELEVGTVVGVGSERGRPITTGAAADHLYGLTLVNDWSARDIQAYEYQPLGPFLGKSFATSMSPWLVSFEALAPYRVEAPRQDPPVAPYLRCDDPWGFDIELEVLLETTAMRAAGAPPETVGRTCYSQMYWTVAQQLAHLTVNGANVRPGDVLASGTVSGPGPGETGSMIERTDDGRSPITIGGELRSFLEDGDRVVMRAWAGNGSSPHRLGLGEVSGTVVASMEVV